MFGFLFPQEYQVVASNQRQAGRRTQRQRPLEVVRQGLPQTHRFRLRQPADNELNQPAVPTAMAKSTKLIQKNKPKNLPRPILISLSLLMPTVGGLSGHQMTCPVLQDLLIGTTRSY
jgi:hypothetical protein